jgi:hypothetical protein
LIVADPCGLADRLATRALIVATTDAAPIEAVSVNNTAVVDHASLTATSESFVPSDQTSATL